MLKSSMISTEKTGWYLGGSDRVAIPSKAFIFTGKVLGFPAELLMIRVNSRISVGIPAPAAQSTNLLNYFYKNLILLV